MSSLYGRRSTGKLWGSRNAQTKGEIDLRAEIDEIFNGSTSKPQRGHWVIYRRFDMNTTSKYYDEVYREGVGGPAQTYVDEIVVCRRDPLLQASQGEAETPMGELPGGKYIYYLEHNIVPSIRDQIFEIEWADHTTKPLIHQIPTPYNIKFNIKEVYANRLDSGRVEYWYCHAYIDKVNY